MTSEVEELGMAHTGMDEYKQQAIAVEAGPKTEGIAKA